MENSKQNNKIYSIRVVENDTQNWFNFVGTIHNTQSEQSELGFIFNFKPKKGIFTRDTGLRNRHTYEGEFNENGERHGQGVETIHYLNSDDLDKYEGNFKENYKDGYGRMLTRNGAVYTGEWKKNKRHGQGRYTNTENIITEGQFVDDKPVNGWKTS
jgi:hypothetical protein